MNIEVWFNKTKMKTFDNIEEARAYVKELSDSKKNNIDLYRYWENRNNDIVVDYGSHNDFIYIKGIDIVTYMDYID